jgi:hypothetical protein
LSVSHQQDLQSSRIEGKVTQRGGSTPVAAAFIRVLKIVERFAPNDFASRQIASAYADGEGTYTIAAPPGTYDVRASNFNYIAQVVPSVHVPAEGAARADFSLE